MARIDGYPPHLWVEPYREVVYRVVWGRFCSLAYTRDDKLMVAADELVEQGFLRQNGGVYVAAGLTYRQFVPTDKLKVKELKHAC